MNRKTIIQICVIIVAFGASGLVLYNGFGHSGAPVTVPPLVSSVPGAAVVAVPGGGTLDLANIAAALPYTTDEAFSKSLTETLSKPYLQYGTIQYPVLNVGADVGVNPANVIK